MKQLTRTLMVAVVAIMGIAVNTLANTVRSYILTVKDTTITVTADWDFTLKSSTPFGDNGFVDIVNTEHAVLIIDKVKPSAALKLLSHVKINGQAAKDGTNCQVKLYNRGTIIMPYASDLKPLTVYSEQNFGGEAVNAFGLENSGGFMNTLSEAKLNNKIRSFKLKRGHMVTFSTLPNGRGYSRCFIAADKDLEVKTLPAVLDQKITSYRVFRWYDTGKACLANDTRAEAVSKLNVTSCYSFSLGESRLPDAECVPHHIYEDWPSPAECGKVTYSPHLKTNNEPGNSADDHPQTVDEVLNNWENLMATGMRLCSPSSHDGSLSHLRSFMQAIDERGWRCDILDLHCYWNEWNLNHNVEGWYNTYKRPIWVSEWVWGSSWGNEGIFKEASSRDNPTASDFQKNKTVIQGVCENWNKASYIERYYYWNSEADCSKILINGTLTPAGEYYASINSGLAYTGATSYVPTTPKQADPSKFNVNYDKENAKATLTWYDSNGEYNQMMEVQRSTDDGATWQTVCTVEQQEAPANYTYTDETGAADGVQYRVCVKDLNGQLRYTEAAYTSVGVMKAGAAVSVGDKQLYVGGNLLTYGGFELGLQGWTSGTGQTVAQPWFQALPKGGFDGGTYLQCYGDGAADDAASLKQYVAIEPGADYLFRYASCDGGSQSVSVAADKQSAGTEVLTFASAKAWQVNRGTFSSGDNSYALISFSQLGGKARFQQLSLYRLFDTQEAALADAAAKQQVFDETVDRVARAAVVSQRRDSLLTVAEGLCLYAIPQKDAMQQLMDNARQAATTDEMASACEALQQAVTALSPATEAPVQPTSPNFYSESGWTTKAGTYKAGDQKCTTVSSVPCWNAWWSGISASEGTAQTLEVRQTVSKLPEGLYVLECKAATEHYCLSDQHGYITSGDDTRVTPTLTYDYWDLQSVLSWGQNIWQTLTTTPVYVAKNDAVTIGFTSSKQGAVDNAWHQIGKPATSDKREGWWCATGFRLLYSPVFKLTTKEGQWGTLCLDYAASVPQNLKCYRVAGVLKDRSQVCLEELTEIAAGQPIVYHAEAAEALFFESGEPVTTPLSAETQNNLRGYITTGLVNAGYFELVDGSWTMLTARKRSGVNVAFLTSLDGLTEYDSWTGVTLPVAIADAIQTVGADNQPSSLYTVGGRRSANGRGLVIETKGQSSRKVVK